MVMVSNLKTIDELFVQKHSPDFSTMPTDENNFRIEIIDAINNWPTEKVTLEVMRKGTPAMYCEQQCTSRPYSLINKQGADFRSDELCGQE